MFAVHGAQLLETRRGLQLKTRPGRFLFFFKTIVVTLSWESPLSQLAGLSNLKGKYDVAVRSDWDVERVDNRLILKRRCQMSILGFLISNQKDHCVICFIRYKMVLMHPTNLTNVISFNFEMKWSLKSNMCSSQIRNSEKSLSVPWSCTDFQKFKQKAFDTRVISSSICDKPCIYHMTPIKIIHKKPGKNNRKLFNNSSVFYLDILFLFSFTHLFVACFFLLRFWLQN